MQMGQINIGVHCEKSFDPVLGRCERVGIYPVTKKENRVLNPSQFPVVWTIAFLFAQSFCVHLRYDKVCGITLP